MPPKWKNSWEVAGIFALLAVLVCGFLLDSWAKALFLAPGCGAAGFLAGSFMTLLDSRDHRR